MDTDIVSWSLKISKEMTEKRLSLMYFLELVQLQKPKLNISTLHLQSLQDLTSRDS